MYCQGNCFGVICKTCSPDSGNKSASQSALYLSSAGQIMANHGQIDRNSHLRSMPMNSQFFHNPFHKYGPLGMQRVFYGAGIEGTTAAAASYLPAPAFMAFAASRTTIPDSPPSPAMSSHFSDKETSSTPVSGAASGPPPAAHSISSLNALSSHFIASQGQTNPDSQAVHLLHTDHILSNGGAFKPVSNDRDSTSFSSAFVQPSKCPKLEPCSTPQSTATDIYGGSIDDRSAAHTPVSTDGSDRSTPEEGRRLRGKKRGSVDGQASCCPVCSVTVRPQDLLHHFKLEIERLQQISKSVKRSSMREGASHGRNMVSPPARRRRDSASTSSSESRESKSQSRWDTYLRVKSNRSSRLGIKACKSGKRCKRIGEDSGSAAAPGAVISACPVCGEKLCCNVDEMNSHVDMCLNKKDMSEEENIDVDGHNNGFEEYEWAGQTRIRATALLEGGFPASGITVLSKPKMEDEDEGDLNVDVDDSTTYGSVQYTEADIIPCKSSEVREQKQRDALRDAVMGGETVKHTVSECSKWSSNQSTSTVTDRVEDDQTAKDSPQKTSEPKSIVDSLKSKIKELDDSSKNLVNFKCLICMEQYTNPLVSVCCWHVHCEECWLRTLGAKKLCPQCNIITSAKDLRRVYL